MYYRQQGNAMLMNLYVISLGAANVFNCAGHLPLLIGSAVQRGWGYYVHSSVCNLDGVILYASSIITVIMLAWMTISNTFVMKHSLGGRCPAVTSQRIRLAIVYAWVHGLVLCLPLMVPSFVTGKYLCQVGWATPTVFVWIILLLGFLIPILVIVVLNVDLACTVIHERKYSVQIYKSEKTVREPEQILIEVGHFNLFYSRIESMFFFSFMGQPYFI